MNRERILGLLFIILGLLFVIYPIFSSAFLSILIGFSLVCFGMSSICMGIVFTETSTFTILSIILGIIAVLFGMMFLFFLNAVPFLVSLQFYIAGFLMILYGLMGIIFMNDKKSTIISAIGLILGILTVALAVFAASQPILIAIIIGALLIVDGVFLLVIGGSETLIENYG